jgi:hypothetical protein
VYRFLPWTRRGLAASITDNAAAAAGSLPARAAVKLDVVLTGGHGSGSTTTDVAGPGDVVGIDPAAIVRLTPRPDSSNVEPNFLAAVDFDDPDLPWLFTPSAANALGQLRPWLALVVVEDRPGVSVTAAAPLPKLTIESGAAQELPSLADSWAWAHTQLLVAEGTGLQAASFIASDPDRHVSRLLCPRRLRANARWLACLVPAFDAGVARGLGTTPESATLAPAWTEQDSITLPVYFHWSFGTGPEGDFETLARRLTPFVIETEDGVPSVGTVKMHIGAAGGPVDLPDGHPQHVIQMDGALRALGQDDGVIGDIPAELRQPLGELLDDIADPSGTDPDDGAVGPPLYGAWAANRFHVADLDDGWFAEANLDPRARVAAGLGAEVVRREQEDLMTACWQQVGAVLSANALLSRARLSIEASLRLHAKSIAVLPSAEVLTFASPLAGRAPMAGASVRAAIGPTSLPDASVDPAMRRFVAPTGRFMRKAAKVAEKDPAIIGAGLLGKLAAGTPAVDPTTFVPIGIAPRPGAVPVERPNGQVDLAPIGLPVVRTREQAAQMIAGSGTTFQPVAADRRLSLRADLRQTGFVTSRHVAAIREVAVDPVQLGTKAADPILALQLAAKTNADPSGFVLGKGVGSGLFEVRPMDITRTGTVVLRTPETEPNIVVGRLGAGVNIGTVTSRMRSLPAEALQPGEGPFVIRSGPTRGELLVRRRRDDDIDIDIDRDEVPDRDHGPIFEGPVVTVPPLVKDAAVIGRFEEAIGHVGEVSGIGVAAPTTSVVAFQMAAAAAALTARCDPAFAHTSRVASMVRFGSTSLGLMTAGTAVGGLTVAPRFDRIMAYPELRDPSYRLLARYDRARLLPGVDSIPPDSVTLLETNPRFVASFLAGLNHELNRELLWRRYPTDQRGTPLRRFWDRTDGGTDVAPMHQWRPLSSSLVDVAGGESNLVLLIRGELLRRYPNTVVLAIRASDPTTPSSEDGDVLRPIFSGLLEPDISFFGFDLEDDDIHTGNGWFFALQEQITEPRFGFDETVDPLRGELDAWRELAWTDTDVQSGAPFTTEQLRTTAAQKRLDPVPSNGAMVAEAMFQNPVQVLVHGRNLTEPLDA